MAESKNEMSFTPDTFTENDVLGELDRAGLKYHNGKRYIVTQCPTHEDNHPSTQIFKDDWFVNCLAGCGRYHITKAFPALLPDHNNSATASAPQPRRKTTPMEQHYKTYDLYEWWETLPLIPRDHKFKEGMIPLDTLDELGWRWDEPKNSYFIPYFGSSHQTVPFGQWRHLTGERRFTFLKDAKPTAYGMWNIEGNPKLFVCEGASDAAVLDYAAVPWIAMPSAASAEIMKGLANYAKKNGIQLVYAGDNDEAGDKLKDALSEIMPFRCKQARKPYKDWGEMLEAEGYQSVVDYCHFELFSDDVPDADDWVAEAQEQLKLQDSGMQEQPSIPPQLL